MDKCIIPVEGVGPVELPGSKSMSNRALLIAAMSGQEVTIQGVGLCEDVLIMLRALRQLGVEVDINVKEKSILVRGCSGNIPLKKADIYVGNAGTVARFLPAMLCLCPGGEYTFKGAPQMTQRPIKPLLDVLEALGCARIVYHGEIGYYPFTLKTEGFIGGAIALEASLSSQFVSALMMLGAVAQSPLRLLVRGKRVSWPFVDLTKAMLSAIGADIVFERDSISIRPQASLHIPQGLMQIESDATACSYFAVLSALIQKPIDVYGFYGSELQGDWKFIDILEQAFIVQTEKSFQKLTFIPGTLNTGLRADFSSISDTFMSACALSPFLSEPIEISGIAHTAFQECNRIHAMKIGLELLGQNVKVQQAGGLLIEPSLPCLRQVANRRLTTIPTFDDHRIAMSFSVLGCVDVRGDGTPWLKIEKPTCVSKTFPNFYEQLSLNHGISL